MSFNTVPLVIPSSLTSTLFSANSIVSERISDIVEPLSAEETQAERAERITAEEELSSLTLTVNELKGKKAAMIAAEDVRAALFFSRSSLFFASIVQRDSYLTLVFLQFEGAGAVKQQLDAAVRRLAQLEEIRGTSKVSDEQAWLRALVVARETLETTRRVRLHN